MSECDPDDTASTSPGLGVSRASISSAWTASPPAASAASLDAPAASPARAASTKSGECRRERAQPAASRSQTRHRLGSKPRSRRLSTTG